MISDQSAVRKSSGSASHTIHSFFILSHLSRLASNVIHLEEAAMGPEGSRPACSAEVKETFKRKGECRTTISGSHFLLALSLTASKSLKLKLKRPFLKHYPNHNYLLVLK